LLSSRNLFEKRNWNSVWKWNTNNFHSQKTSDSTKTDSLIWAARARVITPPRQEVLQNPLQFHGYKGDFLAKCYLPENLKMQSWKRPRNNGTLEEIPDKNYKSIYTNIERTFI
jgi:hypothetical protein